MEQLIDLDKLVEPGMYEFSGRVGVVSSLPIEEYPHLILFSLSTPIETALKINIALSGSVIKQRVSRSSDQGYVFCRDFKPERYADWYVEDVDGKIVFRPSKTRYIVKSTSSAEYTSSALVVTIRDEAPYLLDWISYHLAIGFDRIIFYSNDNTDRGIDLINAIGKYYDVSHYSNDALVDIPDGSKSIIHNPQYRAYWRAIKDRVYGDVQWVGFFDIDEYLVLNRHDAVASFLKDHAGLDAIAMNWKCFGSSGLLRYEPSPVFERFNWCAQKNWWQNGTVKTIARANAIKSTAGGHLVVLHDPEGKYGYTDGRRVTCASNADVVVHDMVQLNHYQIGSVEDFLLRRLRGDVIVNEGDLKPRNKYNSGYFILMDRNEETDQKVDRFVPNVMMKKKALLARSDIAEIQELIQEDTARKIAEVRHTIPYYLLPHVEAERVRLSAITALPGVRIPLPAKRK